MKIWYFSFNFSLKKNNFPATPRKLFFSIKNSAKKRRTRLKNLLSSCESIKVDNGRGGESKWDRPRTCRTPSPGGCFFHSLCRLLGSSLYSIKYDIFMKCQSRRQWTGKIRGRKHGKNERKVQWEMGFFSWDYRCQLLLGWWSIVKSNNIKFESYLCLIFMRCALQWWAFDCPATLRFSFCGLDLQKEHGRMKTENRDFRMSIVSHKYRFN